MEDGRKCVCTYVPKHLDLHSDILRSGPYGGNTLCTYRKGKEGKGQGKENREERDREGGIVMEMKMC
jgi:hypothetical protein